MTAARPPRSWELQTLAVLAAIGVTAVLGMVLLATQLVVRSYLLSDGASGMSPMVASVVRNADAWDVLYLMLGLGYIGGFFWWRHNTREMLRRVGDADGNATRHWAVPVWTAGLVASFVLRQATDPYSSDAAGDLGLDALRTGIRVVALGVLMFGVWGIREQVRRTVAESGVALRVADLRTTPAPGRPLPPVTRAASPSSTDLPAADDGFWDGVRRAAGEAGTELAMLETTGGLVRRWALVPAAGDIAAVRAAVPEGAIVTVFTRPPADTEIEAFTPEPAEEYHGFLEDAESGALWFQSVRPNRVPAFLARARSARRWALYPVGTREALSAVVTSARPTTPAGA